MLGKFLKVTTLVALAFAFTAAPLSFDLSAKNAYADSKEKGEKEKKEKTKADKDCSRGDQNCNDQNDNRKSDDKSQKGGKSDEMKAKGKKK